MCDPLRRRSQFRQRLRTRQLLGGCIDDETGYDPVGDLRINERHLHLAVAEQGSDGFQPHAAVNW